MDKALMDNVKARAKYWLSDVFDEETRSEVQQMLDDNNSSNLINSFYKDLEFGTGGLRGIMGAGTNRMNIYTVGAATQGLCNYLNNEFSSLDEIKVAIGHDCRNNSRKFAEASAQIFTANGIKVFLFEDLRPTPELSFAIRELGCQSGIILTASHNPKEYNGYKAYWNDGSQIVAPHDKLIVEEVKKVTVDAIKWDGNSNDITTLGEDFDRRFIEKTTSVVINPDVIKRHSDLKIVFTPIHGTGVKIVPTALDAAGFKNVIHVPEQDVVSGDFPTVVSPNPEEPAAMEMAMDKARQTDADIVMANDPDADRIGVCTKNDKGEWFIVNGNQTALLFLYYIITQYKAMGKIRGNEFVVKTIVTSELIAEIARKNNIEYFDCYTGFKFIAEVIRDNEPEKKYIGGGEESFGFMPADFVRDKDAVSSCVLMAEIAAWAKDQGKSLYDLLKAIYLEYGFSKEKMKYIVREGQQGAVEIQTMMKNFRSNPPESLGGSKLEVVKDYSTLIAKNRITGEEDKINQKVSSNVLQFFTQDGTKISVRPSGTEPKIKFYIEVKDQLKTIDEFDEVNKRTEDKVNTIMDELVK
ncbi:MAG: phospho-sugar mutase [Prolixibacteraceae bacterium]|nr:phospho-sugar mutase [Prolixibacteraceae bacterium]MBN2649167.1 phospho-sugar mutase [Prolixibacteraceae bacterium]